MQLGHRQVLLVLNHQELKIHYLQHDVETLENEMVVFLYPQKMEFFHDVLVHDLLGMEQVLA